MCGLKPSWYVSLIPARLPLFCPTAYLSPTVALSNFVSKWLYQKIEISHYRKFMDVYLLTIEILKDATIGMHGHYAFYAQICQNDSK